jgi:hypothetical protein
MYPKRVFEPGLRSATTALLLSILALLCATPLAAEKLLYSVTSGQPGRFPRIEKTEIFSVDPQDGSKRLIFSDAHADFQLITSGEKVMAAAEGRIFAPGYARKTYTSGFPSFPAAIYELSTDGTNRARKILDLEGANGTSNYRQIFVNPAGSKIGHINSIGGRWHVLLHDAATGTLLLDMDLTPIALDCFVREIGWMPNGKQLFFTLETGDVDATSDASYARAGTYLMPDTGGTPQRLAAAITVRPKRAGYQPMEDTPPTLLDQLPGGEYLFSEFQWKQGGTARIPAKAETFLFTTSPTGKVRNDYSLGANPQVGSVRPSPTGRRIAFITSDEGHRSGPDLIYERTVRILDLETGTQKDLFTFPSKILNLPATELIGWIDD